MVQKKISYSITAFSSYYGVQTSFIQELNDIGLIELTEDQGERCVDDDQIALLEHLTRLHKDFNVNVAGLDVIEDLLTRIEGLKDKVRFLESKAALLHHVEE